MRTSNAFRFEKLLYPPFDPLALQTSKVSNLDSAKKGR